MSKTVDGIKMATKALRATRKRLESIEDVQQYQGDQLGRIERTLGSVPNQSLSGMFSKLAEGLVGPKTVMGELSAIRSVQENHQSATLNQLRDIKQAVNPSSATVAGVLAKLDAIVPEVQGINGGLGKVRADLINAVRDLTGNVRYLRTDVGALHDRQAETYDMLKAVRADVGTIRSGINELEDGQRQARNSQSSSNCMPILAAIRDGIKALRADIVDVAAEQADDLGQRIDRMAERVTLFEQQERVADRDAGYRGEVMGALKGLATEYESESRHQSVIVYLKALEAKIDAISSAAEDAQATANSIFEGLETGKYRQYDS